MSGPRASAGRSLLEAPRPGGSAIGTVASAVADNRVDEVRDGGFVCERQVQTHRRRTPRMKPALTKIAPSDEQRATSAANEEARPRKSECTQALSVEVVST
jgi:hypothetical protein